MILVIAEKPSVAQSIAKVLGATSRKDGYMEGGNYIVSWCFGHLVELADASSYDERYAKWRYDDLPIVPENWMFEVTKDKAQQFKVLSALMKDKRVTELVCATDAGREGELIFRLVYNKAGCTKPFKRLWISSLEDSAIREGFNHLRDGKEYDRLYEAALSRSKADWIVGINGTRLFTTLYHKKLVVGRVQTPTLAMLVERDGKISTFQKEKYFNIHVGKGDLTADLEKVKTEEEAKKKAAEELAAKAEEEARKKAAEEAAKAEAEAKAKAEEARKILEAAKKAEEEALKAAEQADSIQIDLTQPAEEGKLPLAASYLEKYTKMEKSGKSLVDTFNAITVDQENRNVCMMGDHGFGLTSVGEDFARSFYDMGICKAKTIAKIKAQALNKVKLADAMSKLAGGCMVVENAGLIAPDKMTELMKLTAKDVNDVVVILTGATESINRLFGATGDAKDKFTHQINMEGISTQDMLAIAKGYFKQQGFKTDDSVEGTVKNLLMAMESGNIDRMLKACDEAMLKCDDREKAKGSSRKYLLSEDFK